MNYFYSIAVLCLLTHNQTQADQPCMTQWPEKKQSKKLPRYQSIAQQLRNVTPGINPDLNDQLFEAIETDDLDRVQYLLNPQSSWWVFGRKDIPDVNARNWQGKTPLIFAIELLWSSVSEKRMEIIKLLLQAKANPDIKDSDGITALRYAVSLHNTNIVKLLLEADANPDIQDSEGNTALIIASLWGQQDIVTLLLNAHANPNIMNSYNETALSIAASRRNFEIIKKLLHADAKPTENFWRIAKANPAVMKAVEEYNKEASQYNKEVIREKKSIQGATAQALQSEGLRDVSYIIGEYAARPFAQEAIEQSDSAKATSDREEKEKKEAAA